MDSILIPLNDNRQAAVDANLVVKAPDGLILINTDLRNRGLRRICQRNFL